MRLHLLAIMYALAVALACPAVLDASEEGQAPASPGAQEAAPDVQTPPQPPPDQPPADAASPPTAAAAPAHAAQRAAAPEASPAAPRVPAAPSARAQAAASASVAMRDFSFSPATVGVEVGDSVTWTNQGQAPHTATGDGFDTGNVGPGESGSATFSRAGSFPYVCSIHPNMRGTVRVASTAGEAGGADRPTGDGEGASAGSSAGTGASGRSPGAATSAAGEPTLPASGLDTELFGLIGVGLLALGVFLRRRTVEG
jgi:plastocyanin